jgi:kynurenine formamidase
VHATHEHRFQPQTPGSLTLRQFIESLRRWTPEMRQIAQIALTRTEAERQQYLKQFHSGHHRTHKTLLSRGIVIVEGLDLSAPPRGTYELYCLPLLLAGIDGAPSRAVLVG